MPVPSLVTDLSTTAASNSPTGGDSVFPDLDNYLRALSAFVASIYANSGNGWVSPYLPLAGGTLTGTLNGTAAVLSSTVTASALIPSSLSVPTNGMYLPAANTPAIASSSTLRWSVNATGNHTLVAASSGATFTVGGAASISIPSTGRVGYLVESETATVDGITVANYGATIGSFTSFGNLGAALSGYYGVHLITAGTARLSIASNGAATFSSTLAITGALTGVTTLAMGGALTGVTDLTTTGNTILGNALGDTLSVAADTLKVHSDGRVSGTKLHNIGTVTGTTDQFIASGTYTPSLTNSLNISASTAYQCQWMRVGNVVTVSGAVAIDPTSASTQTTLGISLPIASDFTTQYQGNGVATREGAYIAISGAIFADSTNNRVAISFLSDADVANRWWSFTFTYEVV